MIGSKHKHLDIEIIRLYDTGKSAYAIAKALDLGHSTVDYRLNINNVKKRSISEASVGRPKSEAHRKVLGENRVKSGVAKGSRNPNWQGGVSTEHDKIRHNTEQKLWKRAIKERDGACMSCGSRERLHAHHILPFSTHPHLRTAISNGITLCKKCHKALHKRTKSIWGELLETPNVKTRAISSRACESRKVQRLCTPPERDDIVSPAWKHAVKTSD